MPTNEEAGRPMGFEDFPGVDRYVFGGVTFDWLQGEQVLEINGTRVHPEVLLDLIERRVKDETWVLAERSEKTNWVPTFHRLPEDPRQMATDANLVIDSMKTDLNYARARIDELCKKLDEYFKCDCDPEIGCDCAEKVYGGG